MLTLVNRQRVAALLDDEAAELLDQHGLIRHDSWSAAKPEVWKLRVNLGAGAPKRVSGLRNEIEDIIDTYNHAHGINATWRYGKKERASFECLYYREAAGKSQLTLATKAGLNASLTPCIVLPVKDYM